MNEAVGQFYIQIIDSNRIQPGKEAPTGIEPV
jgi:hypothetical protein